MKTLIVLGMMTCACLAQDLSDSDIAAAIARGRGTPTKKLWNEIKKRNQFRVNRAGLDPIEKKVTFLSDRDRIALESAEAARTLREVSVADVRKNVNLGIIEVLLEANCYNHSYAGSLPKWGPGGGVHLVLVIDGQIVQPLAEVAGRTDSVSVLPQDHGVISQNGNQVTYTPLYRSAIYERASQRAWFVFPHLQPETKSVTVTVISGDGNKKSATFTLP